jgi:7-keto-8-aminopelargonate synthetase-like enzyme
MLNRRRLLKGAVAAFMTAGMGVRNLLAQLIGSRYRFTMDSGPGPETVINGKRYLYFGGTGYFGFQTHPELIQAAQKGLAEFGLCTATSRNIFGTSPLHLEVEKKAREFFGGRCDRLGRPQGSPLRH